MNQSDVLGVLKQIRIPPRRAITVVFALGMVGVIWYRNTSTPAVIEQSKPNPASAAAEFDPSSSESDQQLLPDRLNLAYQQLISARAQQIKADISREIADPKSRCARKSPVSCGESKLSELNQKIVDTIGDDGGLKISPSRALGFNNEAQAILAALKGLGVKDAETERLTQIYLRATGGEYATLSGVASAITGTQEYLERRRIDRLSAAGKSEDIPQRKTNNVGIVKTAVGN